MRYSHYTIGTNAWSYYRVIATLKTIVADYRKHVEADNGFIVIHDTWYSHVFVPETHPMFSVGVAHHARLKYKIDWKQEIKFNKNVYKLREILEEEVQKLKLDKNGTSL